MLLSVKGKILPIVLMVAFALTRIPGMLPQNFSAAYAIAFCAGVFFPQRLAWWVPLITLLITDLALNCYYQFHLGYECFTFLKMAYLMGNYGGYAFLIWLGKRISSKASFVSLLGGGILGALAFYFITNTLSWLINPFNNPEYTKTLSGWIWALTKGTGNWPTTLEFFRNTLLSGGLFTGLFVGAMKLADAPEPEEKEEEAEEPEAEPAEAETRPAS